MTYEAIQVEVDGHIGLIRLNRPERSNAATPRMQLELPQALRELRERRVRALIVTGAGRAFCAGTDISRLSRSPEAREEIDEDEWDKRRLPPGTFAVQFQDFPAPTIAAVNGIAAGMGLSLTLACDIRIAAVSGRFSAIWTRRGLVPDTGTTVLLPRIVGLSNALQMMYEGSIVSAQDALAMGLVSRVVPDDELLPAAREIALRLAKNPPIALELTKRMTYANQQQTPEAAAAIEMYHNMTTAGPSDDSREAVRAFLEKREGEYKGR